ncbi:MAG: efflux RND transporter periplasmic adaptor subunit [Acidobacteriaceae bacterium]|jgi:RND family efflux transporter MFP subunit|nr:efflux RND transporter periplasmic adaptor subunit [Acidobacteriaceae bacterium]
MTRARALQGALCLCLLAGSACREQASDDIETATAVTVTTATAERATIRAVVHATGIVSPAPGAEFIVVAPDAARIIAIPHAFGERVKQGDLLVQFEIPASAAEVQKQTAEVTRAEAGLQNARAAQTRAQGLLDRGIAARKEVEDTVRAVADAEAALTQANVALNAARTVEHRSTVEAPFDGVISQRTHNPGDLVEAASSDSVLRLVDLARLEVTASIPLPDATRIRMGAMAHLVNTPTETPDVELTIKSQPTAVDPATGTVPVRLGFARPVNIPVGTPVQIEINAEEHRNVVVVPAAAVVHEGEDVAVFVVSDDKAHRRPVHIGIADGTHVEIVDGINAGDTVIVDGHAGLPDEAPVTDAPKDKDEDKDKKDDKDEKDDKDKDAKSTPAAEKDGAR